MLRHGVVDGLEIPCIPSGSDDVPPPAEERRVSSRTRSFYLANEARIREDRTESTSDATRRPTWPSRSSGPMSRCGRRGLPPASACRKSGSGRTKELRSWSWMPDGEYADVETEPRVPVPGGREIDDWVRRPETGPRRTGARGSAAGCRRTLVPRPRSAARETSGSGSTRHFRQRGEGEPAWRLIRVPYPDDPDERRRLFARAAATLSRHGSYQGTPEAGTFHGRTAGRQLRREVPQPRRGRGCWRSS